MEEHDDSQSEESEEMATEIIDSVLDDSEEEDGLSSKERTAEAARQAERIARAKQLRKKLRRRELGVLRFRWPAAIMIISGIISIWSEFLVVFDQQNPFYQFNTFFEAFQLQPNIFWVFPIIAGVGYIILGIIAYFDSRAPWLGLIPAMLIVMSGGFMYMMVSFAYAADDNAAISATGIPMTMMLMGLMGLVSIFMREKE
ncbi:MAG: hypothetical protein GF411_20625 [Candidatus Lokiarchaeota archaeon]|nr:hypothetical protein [Candidatus Lokiarchaeota archaeon]